MKTFADVMAINKGHTTGFDYLRVFLATAVVLDHSFLTQGTEHIDVYKTHFEVLWNAILPSFFALSGILVASSLIRNSIPQFLALRILRLFPALAVEVTLSAVILGAIFTTLPLMAYYADPMTHEYFLNMFGLIHFPLPGVFDGTKLNAQLWTIPIELDCYLTIVAVGLLGLTRRRGLLLGMVLTTQLALTVITIYHPLVLPQHPPTGRVLVLSFLAGVIIHFFRDRVPYHPAVFAAALAALWFTLSFPVTSFLSPFPTAYVVGYIGLTRLPRIKFGDLSYGLYLFHYPLMRVIEEVSGGSLRWYEVFPLAMIVGCLFAALSWNLIEKPLLGRKKNALALVDHWIPASWHGSRLLNPIEALDVRRHVRPLADQPEPFASTQPVAGSA